MKYLTMCVYACRSVDDLEAVLRVLFGKKDGNYFPAPIPYREVETAKKLRFGYYTTGKWHDVRLYLSGRTDINV